MRTAAVALSILCFAGTAFATAEKGDTTKGEHGDTSAPSDKSSGPSSSSEQAGESVDRSFGTGGPLALKRFKFELGWENHAFLASNNFEGDGSVGTGGAEVEFNYFYAGATYYITPSDKLAVVLGMYLFHLYNPGGPDGFSPDDGLLRYTHHFALPWKLNLDASASVSAPFSNLSYKMGLITEPQLRVSLSRTFAKYVYVDLRVFGDYYWQQYSSMIGGSTPNPYARAGARLNVEGQLPYHPALALGVDVETGYTAFYNPTGQPLGQPGEPNATTPGPYYGIETNPIYSGQPLQQDYGYDVYLKYDFPKLAGVKAEALVAYAQGDPTAGYTTDLIDGASNLYLYYPEASQVYFSLDLTY
ncbi:MAG TPA: hypothetical protein VMB50_00915 [Myxococcales bacterium]|nr:hypothetical protein [Myxococcales bacterium]